MITYLPSHLVRLLLRKSIVKFLFFLIALALCVFLPCFLDPRLPSWRISNFSSVKFCGSAFSFLTILCSQDLLGYHLAEIWKQQCRLLSRNRLPDQSMCNYLVKCHNHRNCTNYFLQCLPDRLNLRPALTLIPPRSQCELALPNHILFLGHFLHLPHLTWL